MAQLEKKNLPSMWETWVWSLVWEGPLEKGKATHSSILAWRIPWTVYFVGLQRVSHDWVTFTYVTYIFTPTAFKIFSSWLFFNILIIMCFSMVFPWGSLGLRFVEFWFYHIWKPFSILFSDIFSLSLSYIYNYIR